VHGSSLGGAAIPGQGACSLHFEHDMPDTEPGEHQIGVTQDETTDQRQ
jgi:hypothetical protein